MALPVREMTLTEAVDTSRTGSAWYFDENGVFQEESTSDTARIDYDPNGGARLGLMSEGASTNLLTYSEDLSNGAWQKSRVTLGATVNFATNIALTKLVENSDTSQFHLISDASGVTVTSGAIATFSCFALADERSRILLRIAQVGVVSSRFDVTFDLSNGTVASAADFGTATNLDSKVVDMGGGVYRLQVTCSIPSVSTYVVTAVLDNGSGIQYNGDGTSGLYVGGFQLEELPGASSYIPTTTAQVTRAAETHTLVSLDPWYRASGYSVAVQFQSAIDPDATTQRVAMFTDDGGTNSLNLELTPSNDSFRVRVLSGGVEQADMNPADPATLSANTAIKVAARISPNDFGASVDGNAAVTDSAGDAPSPATTFYVGRNISSGLQLYGWIQDIKYTTELWDDATLATESGTTV